MGALTIRRLDDEVIANLKAAARRNGRSMEEEARIALAQTFRKRLEGQEAVEHFRRLGAEISGGRTLPDSTPLFRELREEDPLNWNGK